MKRASSILFLTISLLLFVCLPQQYISAGSGDKVLLIIRERSGSADIQLMRTNEAILMKQTLEEAGFRVEVASASGRTFLIKKITLESDLKLAEVNMADYVGFIITCSNLDVNTNNDPKVALAFGETYVKPEEVTIAKQIMSIGKPVAAQDKGVVILAQAGVLVGKRYSYESDIQVPEAIYGGQSVIQDGNIVTSSHCPYNRSTDQTVELTKALIAELQK